MSYNAFPDYAVHSPTEIKGFFAEYRWLSNFWICPVMYERIIYQSAECAYHAAKIKPEFRPAFIDVQPSIAKKMWKTLPLEDDDPQKWIERSTKVMCGIVFDKFWRNDDLRLKLLNTGTKYLQETNDWGDSTWGYDVKKRKGCNKLGDILMATRGFWKHITFGETGTAGNQVDFQLSQACFQLSQSVSSAISIPNHNILTP